VAKAYASAVIDVPIETVWKIVRDFNGLPTWHPAIASSEIEEGLNSGTVGCIRSFHLKDGAHVREQLLALSDSEHSLSYSFVKPAFPVKNYVAAIRLISITEGDRTFAEWTATFDEEPEDAGKYVEIISTHVFAAGWTALQAKLAG
jgi:uncharacterized protein YndB with AHSA1/START domain